VNKRLDAKGLVAFDPRDATDRAKAIARTIGVSVELLSEPERLRFGELGVFPEDVDIPVGVVARLWMATGDLDDFETEDLLSRLFDRSLLLDLDLGQRFFRLHDTVRHFLPDQASDEGLVALHKQLVEALDGTGSGESDPRTQRYYYLYLPHHLAEANERESLDALLLDPSWLVRKLEATRNPQALFADYQRYGSGQAQSLIGRTLRLISGICTRDRRQLLPQLVGRLAGLDAVVATGFVEEARRIVPRPAIVPIWPGPPGTETARLEGHTGSVTALCPLPDGRLASGSSDTTIRLWDVRTGAQTAWFQLPSHLNVVSALCLLPDGRLASGSWDHTIRLLDVTTGAKAVRLKGHIGRVNALCWLPDGRLASGSHDKTIRLWDMTAGLETARLNGHTNNVSALCSLPDGRLASGSWDKTIRLWDVRAGTESRLKGHTDSVNALCLLSDGRLASGSWDTTIRLWDVTNGAESGRLVGHTGSVATLCQLPDGRVASGSWDKTIRLWDVRTGTEIVLLEGHTDAVVSLHLLPDGRLASGSEDKTIRLWDLTTGAETLLGKGSIGRVKKLFACCRTGGSPPALGTQRFDCGT